MNAAKTVEMTIISATNAARISRSLRLIVMGGSFPDAVEEAPIVVETMGEGGRRFTQP
jgi:hypothetical protein